MAKQKHFIHFKHLTGAVKDIPGVMNKEDLSPRMIYTVEEVPGVGARPILKADDGHVAKILLHDEETDDVRLTEKEQKLAPEVQNRILERRSAEADLRIRANEMLKDVLRSYESRGAIKVIDWDHVVDADSPEAKKSLIDHLSPIALADFADRGLEIPDVLRGSKSVAPPPTTAEKSGLVVKANLPKKEAKA